MSQIEGHPKQVSVQNGLQKPVDYQKQLILCWFPKLSHEQQILKEVGVVALRLLGLLVEIE